MRWLVLVLILLTSHSYAKIGDVIEQVGNTNIERKGGDVFEGVQKDFDVERYDVVKTRDGKTAI